MTLAMPFESLVRQAYKAGEGGLKIHLQLSKFFYRFKL